jgi:ADP-heptose:LPS heptosyltransferase
MQCLKSFKSWIRKHVADLVFFPAWLIFQCVRHRKRAVIVFRQSGLGDVLCTLPLCAEIKKRHSHLLLLYVTMRDYSKAVRLACEPDSVYGAYSWTFSLPPCFFGLVEKVYMPKTTDELSKDIGPTQHLIDDLAASCGVLLTERQPRLYLSKELIEKTLIQNRLLRDPEKRRKLIALSGGRTWPVREWSFDRWQQLVNLIHEEYAATIILFGISHGQPNNNRLTRVESFVDHRVQSHEMTALIAACDLLVSIDSGPVHVAGAVGTPVVALFGAVNPQLRLPPASPGIGLVADVPCLFCHHKTPLGHWRTGCPNDIRCMNELSVKTVFEAVKKMLANR